jgi:glycosyltransferase involved in cell wall biosynthesis
MIQHAVAESPTQTATHASRWLEVVSHTDPRYGGLSAAVPALRHHLIKGSNIDVLVAAFCAPDESFVPPECEPESITFWPASRRPWFSSKLRARISDVIRQADGVHIHGLWESSTAVAASLARNLGIPYILSAHGMLEPWALRSGHAKKLLYSFLVERKNVRDAACLHALTVTEANQYIRYGASSPIAVIPNGVDIPHDVDSSIFLSTYPELQGKRVVLFLARLHPKKGLDLLLEAWSSIGTSWPDAHLVLAGPDCEGTQTKLASFIADRGMTRSVTFTGMLRDEMKWGALAAAECFVLPSRSEGLSVSLLEAMGSGLPVIVTEACNMPEIESFGTGWQVELSAQALAKGMTELLRNTPEENEAMGLRGLNLIRSNYTWPAVARQMAEVYSWVQGGPAPTTTRMIDPNAK